MKGRLPDGTTYQWFPSGPSVAICDWCHHKVWPNQMRLQLHDGKGPKRKGGKGSRSSYLCTTCVRYKTKIRIPKRHEFEQKKKPVEKEEGTLW